MASNGSESPYNAQSDPRGKKRARIESPEPPELKRHETLWFEDGNVVLRAEDTIFRIYRGVLCRTSDVFKDLFTIPQPADADSIDGVPVVRLYDSPLELADFLDVLFNGSRFIKGSTKPTWVLVQSLFRLGTKYDVGELRDAALSYIEELYLNTSQKRRRLYDTTTSPVTYEPADIIAMANLISAYNVRRRLHLDALYACCQLSVKELMEGISHSRGHLERLSQDNLLWCIEARGKLTLESAKMVNRILNGMQACPGDFHCRQLSRAWSAETKNIEVALNPDPLGFLEIPRYQVHYNALKANVCASCYENIQLHCNRWKEWIYPHLDRYIDVPS